MIDRYTRAEMGAIWSLEYKFKMMREVEVSVAEVQAEMNIIPKSAAVAIRKKSKFSVERIQEIELTTKHDVIAFVSNMAENVGPLGRYIHYGLTSSDVLDTALSLQIREAGKLLLKSLKGLEKAMIVQIKKHKDTFCSGRTHGMHAEPTTFGLKLSGFLAELHRNSERLIKALKELEIGKLSGAVGTYSAQSISLEKKVCQKLKLKPEVVATQVIPRDRHAELIYTLAMIGAGIERLSIEFRHLQRTEVSEVIEGFTPGQKGSSAMPHKKNPISAENMTGAARMLRAYASAAIEDIALWHERDISHSSVERIIFPDAFILCDYILCRMTRVLNNIYVDKDRMIKNMEMSQGQLYSSHVLLSLVKKGYTREEAYKKVQSLSHGLKSDESLKCKILEDEKLKKIVSKKEIEDIFSGKYHKKVIGKVIDRVLRRN